MRVYLTKDICDSIDKAIKDSGMTKSMVAKNVGIHHATLCRICNGEYRSIDTDLASKLEDLLGIIIPNVLENNKLLANRVEELEAENRLLKQLLIDKQSKQS